MRTVSLGLVGYALALAAARPLYDARLVGQPPRVTTAAEQRRSDPTATACAVVAEVAEVVSDRFRLRSVFERAALARAAAKRERRFTRNLAVAAAGGAIAV